jgi:hypothetical protein
LSNPLISIALVPALLSAMSTPLFPQTVQDEYAGHFDSCTPTEVTGWALHNKKGASITVVVNGKIIAANVLPNVPRPDVALATGSAPDSGFAFEFPAPLQAGDTVEVKFAKTNKAIAGRQGTTCTPVPNPPLNISLFASLGTFAILVVVLWRRWRDSLGKTGDPPAT